MTTITTQEVEFTAEVVNEKVVGHTLGNEHNPVHAAEFYADTFVEVLQNFVDYVRLNEIQDVLALNTYWSDDQFFVDVAWQAW